MRFTPPFNGSPRVSNLPEIVFASSPEGLVSKGDFASMRRFLMLSGDNEGQDRARTALLQAAANNLACTPAKRVVRIRLYAWPVTVAYRTGVQMPSTIGIGIAQQPQVVLKLRELWSRALGAAHGVLVSPLSSCTHVNSVLSVGPIAIRDCVRHGISILEGKPQTRAWTFDADGVRMEQASPELPATFLFGAYVCWDFNGQEPELSLSPDVRFEMQQLAQGLFTSQRDSVESVHVGEPVVYHEAVTQAQGMLLSAMLRRSVVLGRSLDLTTRVEHDSLQVQAMYVDPNNDDDLSIEWSYNNLWRPGTHLTEISAMVEQEALAIQRRQQVPESPWSPNSFEQFSKFH